jgi:DNA-binding transcriptional ArsR family regulator
MRDRSGFPAWLGLVIVSDVVNDLFGALAHPIRRGIVERLARGSATVGAATRDFNVSKPAISRHLKVLEDAGVVLRTVEGRTHRLVLNVAALTETVDWLDRQRTVWDRMFDAVEDHLASQENPHLVGDARHQTAGLPSPLTGQQREHAHGGRR